MLKAGALVNPFAALDIFCVAAHCSEGTSYHALLGAVATSLPWTQAHLAMAAQG